MTSVENAFRFALREELGKPLSQLMDRLLRVASGLSGRAGSAALPVRALAAAVTVPEPQACAVSGCPLPRGELGYCKAHLLQRTQMIDAGRLHPQWVEGAAPHSVPNVIPPRKRRGEGARATSTAAAATTAAATEAERPKSEPRMWVRKKSGAAPAVTPTASAGPSSKPGPRIEPQQEEQQQIAFTLGRWANEFKSRK